MPDQFQAMKILQLPAAELQLLKNRTASWAASLPDELGNSTPTQTGCSYSVTHPAGYQKACLRSMTRRAPAVRLAEPGLLSLPLDVLDDLTYRLDERDICSLELASRQMYDDMSAFKCGPGDRWLELSRVYYWLLCPEFFRSSA